MPTSPRPSSLGELISSGWRSCSVREELRRNVLRRIVEGRPIIEGVVGFDDTVLPQLERALVAGHDVIFLGERGQAKSRIIRSLVELLDEWTPIVSGSEINDDPTAPISRYARDLVAELGEATPVDWVGRAERYGEKLATPDTSIADLIGEVDPIKLAEGRYLSDELTIHYGLVPRTNRGIFAINELPDLAERIQVGLLNILEERDVQIRGHRVRLPVDVLLVASANPDDYTSRGRIITPLKDRFGAQIRTHYPNDLETEMAIVAQEAVVPEGIDVRVVVPDYMCELVARISSIARQSGHINQRSGVSVRASVANYETLVAAAVCRAARLGEPVAAPRPSDIEALFASTAGKLEIEALEDGDEGAIIGRVFEEALLEVFRAHSAIENLGEVVEAFDGGLAVEVGPSFPSARYVELSAELGGLSAAISTIAGEDDPSIVASAVELVLDGLYLSRRLSRTVVGDRQTYSGRGAKR